MLCRLLWKKEGGQKILCPSHFKMWGDMSSRSPLNLVHACDYYQLHIYIHFPSVKAHCLQSSNFGLSVCTMHFWTTFRHRVSILFFAVHHGGGTTKWLRTWYYYYRSCFRVHSYQGFASQQSLWRYIDLKRHANLLTWSILFDYESGQKMTLKLVFTTFPVWRSALKGQCEEQAGKFTCAVWKDNQLDFPILVWWTDVRQLLSELVWARDCFLLTGGWICN